MKNRIAVLGLSVLILIAACGSGTSGVYEGKGMTLEFKSNNTVYVKVPGLQTKTKYEMDDDKIIISMSSPYPDIILEKKGKSLLGPLGVTLNKTGGWW